MLVASNLIYQYMEPNKTRNDSPIVEVKGLTKYFDSFCAVDKISFNVCKGQIMSLLGPNGSGKSTVLQMLLGLTTPTRGSISLFGYELKRHKRTILGWVNFSSAYTSLPTNLTVWENLIIFSKLYGINAAKKKINQLLELFEIKQTKDILVGTLSSGQITRVNLCKAFLNDPQILFLDEPTASLDPNMAQKVRNIILDIQKEKQLTIVYTSHNMQEVQNISDYVVFLSQGQIISQGTPTEIINNTSTTSLEELFILLAQDQEKFTKT